MELYGLIAFRFGYFHLDFNFLVLVFDECWHRYCILVRNQAPAVMKQERVKCEHECEKARVKSFAERCPKKSEENQKNSAAFSGRVL